MSQLQRMLLQASNSKSAHLIIAGWQFAKVFSPSLCTLSLTSLKGSKALPVTRFRNEVFSSPLSLSPLYGEQATCLGLRGDGGRDQLEEGKLGMPLTFAYGMGWEEEEARFCCIG